MSLANEVCLITGACGFLGERIAKLLLEEEELAELRLFDRNIRPEFIQALEASRDRTKVTVLRGDIRDPEALKGACRGATLVVHTASVIDVTGLVSESELHAVNVKGTQLLLEACIQENVSSFVYTSSIEVMGPNPRGDPIRNGSEDTRYPRCLRFPYSRTKFQAEQLTLQASGGQIATCALRPMYIYGEGCRFLAGHLEEGARNGDVLTRTSRKEAAVNPVYVGNVAWAHVLAARALRDPRRRGAVQGNFYFISDDTPHLSYSDFNLAVMKPLGFRLRERLPLPLPLLFFLSFLLEVAQALLSPFVKFTPPLNRQLLTMLNTPFTFTYGKAQRDLGYSPRYCWEEARARTTDWLAGLLPKCRRRVEERRQP
ncbi:hydroxy-delta-5-steroid dehydrogenase, 3 beta- and steroid delta-isomerase 1 [Lepisosteus oculatus]|uniref:hydroxy-delta-5-steroid dehydrogenase, 3 beta- and steroid delta-isomerase 1 n=1 Tax=Lepisosteus oculatus TaxID=7918 RepID=UPI0035F524D3